MVISFFNSPAKATRALYTVVAFLSAAGCAGRLYSNAERGQGNAFKYPPVYDTIIEPLHNELLPVCKRLYFLKSEVNEMKDRLWDGGSDQRLMRIDENIDILKKEIYSLSDIRRELLNTIYYIYPPYVAPEVVPYCKKNKPVKKSGKAVILVSLEDQQEYRNARSNDESLSEEISYKPLLASAVKKFEALPDSLKKPIEPIGTPGPVPRIRPYEPPPLYR